MNAYKTRAPHIERALKSAFPFLDKVEVGFIVDQEGLAQYTMKIEIEKHLTEKNIVPTGKTIQYFKECLWGMGLG